jgi:hypothetical protein
MPTRRMLRWKVSWLRALDRWKGSAAFAHPATVMVPALHSFMPAENVALGWLNEIEALVTIRHRMAIAAGITGWDVFTFHTLHNADRFFDTTIAAVRDTWMHEGSLSRAAIREAKRRFGKPYDYHRVHARLVENLVFQSSLLDWIGKQDPNVPLRFHVIGTALLSALVSAGSISFAAAVQSATRFGSRWDADLREMANAATDEEVGWSEFQQVRNLIAGSSSLSMGVLREDLPVPEAPARPFWYSPTINSEPMLITTAQEAATALQTLNLDSWACAAVKKTTNTEEPIRGWLATPLHPIARLCRWSVSNYLLATSASVTLFLDNIAMLGPRPHAAVGRTVSEPLTAIENEGHRPLIGQLDVHHRLKHASSHRDS